MSSAFFGLLLIVHSILVIWGLLGFVEYFYPDIPWPGLQNPAFPQGMQFLHWTAIFSGGSIFLAGYLARWKHTPFAMAIAYAMMATLCAVQTLDLMTHSNRYLLMAVEYIAYLSILVYLHCSEGARQRFAK